MKKIIEFLNGKKTVIGSILLIISGVLDESGIVSKLVYAAGSLIVGTGIIHKRKKREI